LYPNKFENLSKEGEAIGSIKEAPRQLEAQLLKANPLELSHLNTVSVEDFFGSD
jgi:hypothetical protein